MARRCRPAGIILAKETGRPICPKYRRPPTTLPCSSSSNEVAGSVSRNWFFSPSRPTVRTLAATLAGAAARRRPGEQSKTGGASSYHVVHRRCTVAVAFAACLGFLRGLEREWRDRNRDDTVVLVVVVVFSSSSSSSSRSLTVEQSAVPIATILEVGVLNKLEKQAARFPEGRIYVAALFNVNST